ncbi:MAG: hypothetical protein GQ582_09830 [Methyloprofundus sp.]|nr:hypothetical protein [Methyloprofundus sp.]
MNETLKQRIVGIAVITALAAIFVPMLFDTPVADPSFNNELSLPQQPNNQLTIPQQPANNLQEILDKTPQTQAEVISQPVPIHVDLQAKKIQKAIKKLTVKGWVIQVGSFTQEQNANEFRDKLRKKKFTAYVDATHTPDKGVLYRLRVGPELDEKIAQNTKQRLDAIYKIKSILVLE